ncbi:MAG: DUF1553 domain-containing protein, partial [Akkermansiaceae bacterium]
NSTSEGSMDGNRYEYAPVLRAPASGQDWEAWGVLESERVAILEEANKLKGSVKGLDQKVWEGSDNSARFAIIADPNGSWKGHALQSRAIDLNKKTGEIQKRFTTTLVTQDLEKPRETKILQRGEYNLPIGDSLEPGVPAVMGSLPKEAPKNRLGLAQWLVSSDQPLVSRVLINRVWQRIFGHGLVRTPEDFGLQGEQPTHPALLDWLAVEFQESGWDLQHILRLLVNSRTFKQDSKWRKEVQDPDNRLFARGQSYRLDAEVIRDIGLWASNLLDPTMGGEGVKPYQPSGMWSALMHPASNTKKYVRDKGERLYRRSIYVYWKRTSPHPMMTLFDAPNRESSCVKRSRSSTALQSLALLNETQRVEMARKLAERLIKSSPDDKSRLNQLYQILACRPSLPLERKACLDLLATMKTRYTSSPEEAKALLSTGEAPVNSELNPAELAAWTQVATTVLATDVALSLF